MLDTVVQFGFIVLVPIVLAAGGLVTLFAVGALFYVLEHPDEAKARVDTLFRPSPPPGKPVQPDHYYRPYWNDAG